MESDKLDWAALDRLRDGFLNGAAATGPYWRSRDDLANYDLTYGERIGWKWDAVLSELRRRNWAPPCRSVLDWGCGSGIAGRRVLEAFGSVNFDTLRVWDHSPAACDFALQAAARTFPTLATARFKPGDPPGTLVLSHVLNELTHEARAQLTALARTADAVIWVEPGTHAVSRDLIGFHEQLLAEFRVVAPCTHQASCGLLAAGNENHWCHYFAAPPHNIYADPEWVKFGQRAGIDLRSLPYSFLVLEKKTAPAAGESNPAEVGAARIIGEPRHYKGFAKLLSCAADGVKDLMLQKRDEPELFKQLKRPSGLPIYRWQCTDDRITRGEQLFP